MEPEDVWNDEGGTVVPDPEEPQVSDGATFVNTSNQTRDWPDLQNPETGATLELGPGEEVKNLRVPEGFACAHLQPKKGK